MKLLDDYIFDERLRYEGHKLIYLPEGDEPIVLGGILGAAILGVRLLNTDEADKRGILLSEALRYCNEPQKLNKKLLGFITRWLFFLPFLHFCTI